MKSLIVLITLFALVGFAGCGQSGDPVVTIANDDESMTLAIEKARATFDKFVNNYQSLPNDHASVKFAMDTSDNSVEHIWFSNIEISGNQITGTCANEPTRVPGLSLGDVRTINRSELSDWMIVAGKQCYGGYTIRVLAEMEPGNAPPLEFIDFE